MANIVENMKKQKKMYAEIKENIPNIIIKLQNILDDLSDKSNFMGYNAIDEAIEEVENCISNLKSVEKSLALSIIKINEKINELEDSKLHEYEN